MKKTQVPVLGGLRKVIKASNVSGTTIAEFGNGTVTLAQLKAALGISTAATTPNTQTKNPVATLAPGPGLSGGGPLVGTVQINLTAPIPAFIFDDGGGGGDGDPGPPGASGSIGATGPSYPTITLFAEDGEDGRDAVPGPQGTPGATVSGPPGPGIYLVESVDGEDALPIPGPQGAPGSQGPPGPLFFNEEPEGEILLGIVPTPYRRVNKGANWYSNSGNLIAGQCNIVYVFCPVAASIRAVHLVSSQAGANAVVDIYKSQNYPPLVASSITASAKPTLASAQVYTDTTLTGWTRNISAGDWLAFVVNSVTLTNQITVVLEIDQ